MSLFGVDRKLVSAVHVQDWITKNVSVRECQVSHLGRGGQSDGFVERDQQVAERPGCGVPGSVMFDLGNLQ